MTRIPFQLLLVHKLRLSKILTKIFVVYFHPPPPGILLVRQRGRATELAVRWNLVPALISTPGDSKYDEVANVRWA
ncbi:hypothetical protein NL676_000063 [Syzygium grande]|nr:hypothetical protein NL676_000063 [Syzygium grande]